MRRSDRCGSSRTRRVSLIGIRRGEEVPCDTLEACLAVSRYLLDQAVGWLD